MIGGRATRAIVAVSLRRAAAFPDVVTLAAFICAVELPSYAPLAFAAAVGWATFGTMQRTRSDELVNLRYFAAPLYGREVARAHTLVAAVPFVSAAVLAAAVFVVRGSIAGSAPSAADWYLVAAMTFGQVVTALVAMSGALRRGRERWLYVGLALAAGLTIDGISSPATPVSLLCAAVIACALGFAALRAFGETLARYDPID